MGEQEAHTALHRAPPNCFPHLTEAEEEDTYLDVTGEDDLLEMPPGSSHLLRGDPWPTLGVEVVVRGPRFNFSVCRGHKIEQPWPMTGPLLQFFKIPRILGHPLKKKKLQSQNAKISFSLFSYKRRTTEPYHGTEHTESRKNTEIYNHYTKVTGVINVVVTLRQSCGPYQCT